MTGQPPTAVRDTSNGRDALRRVEKKAGATMTTLGQPPDTLEVSALVAMKDKGNSGSTITLQQKIMMAGIAQSKMMIEQQQQFKLNDQVTSLYQKKVDAKRMLLNE
jgi:hypothetical protein